LLDESSKAVVVGASQSKRASEQRDYVRSTDDRHRQYPLSMEVSMRMIRSVRWIAVCGSLLASAALNAAAAFAADAEVTTGTLAMSGGSVAAGIGFSWGGGTLTYQGRQYPFTVNGLRIGDVGITDIQGAGTVSHLDRVQDFSGNYTALQAGLTVAGGGGVMTMQNQNGVVITVTSTTQGLDVDLGAGGVAIALK
jgi:hypothetical protein